VGLNVRMCLFVCVYRVDVQCFLICYAVAQNALKSLVLVFFQALSRKRSAVTVYAVH
jgi:hypothetical protein